LSFVSLAWAALALAMAASNGLRVSARCDRRLRQAASTDRLGNLARYARAFANGILQLSERRE